MDEMEHRRYKARARNLRWMEALWEGATTTAWEEDKKEEILDMFRELAEYSGRRTVVSEYVPWQPRW